MASQDEINNQQKLLQIYRGNLAHYLQQYAQFGSAYVPPVVVNNLREAREYIRQIKSILVGWGVEVEEHPDDEDRPSHSVASKKAQSNIYEIVLPRTMNIVGQAEGMLRELARSACNIDIDPDTIDLADIQQWCEAASPNGPAPIIVGGDAQTGWQYGTWLYYLCHWRDRSHNFLEDTRPFFSFMESEHVLLLAKVEQCSYFRQLDILRNVSPRPSNPNICWLASSIWKYLELTRELKSYAATI